MKLVDLTIPLGIGTPPWPTYEPLQVKYFKRLAPNGANGQLLTHSNHLGTHLDGEIHFHTAGKDIAQLKLNDFLVGPGVVIGFFPWRFVGGESSIGRCVAMVDDDEYEELMRRKAELPKTRFGDCYDPEHVERINRLTK